MSLPNLTRLSNQSQEHVTIATIDTSLSTVTLPNGDTLYYEGEGDEERLVRKKMMNGDVYFYEGERGDERRVRKEAINGDRIFFKGGPNQEYTVRIEYADGRVVERD